MWYAPFFWLLFFIFYLGLTHLVLWLTDPAEVRFLFLIGHYVSTSDDSPTVDHSKCGHINLLSSYFARIGISRGVFCTLVIDHDLLSLLSFYQNLFTLPVNAVTSVTYLLRPHPQHCPICASAKSIYDSMLYLRYIYRRYICHIRYAPVNVGQPTGGVPRC